MGSFTQVHICKAGLAAELGLNPSQMALRNNPNAEIALLQSNKGYEYQCYLEGNEVLWKAYPNGRWRVMYASGDTKITWSVKGNDLTINRKHTDGSVSSRSYSSSKVTSNTRPSTHTKTIKYKAPPIAKKKPKTVQRTISLSIKSPVITKSSKKYIIAATEKSDLYIAHQIENPTRSKITSSTGKPVLIEEGEGLDVLEEGRGYFDTTIAKIKRHKGGEILWIFQKHLSTDL